MDLKTFGSLVGIVAGLVGTVGSVGAYFYSNANTQAAITQASTHTQDAVADLERRQKGLHATSIGEIKELQLALGQVTERLAKLEAEVANHRDWLRAETARLHADPKR